MNQIFTLLTAGALCLPTKSSLAQYNENFESTMSSLSGNCWQFVQMDHSSDGGVTPITGTGSLYSQPPTSGSSTRDIFTPYLNISTSLQVSFNHKLSSTLNGNATRTIEIGLMDSSGNFTSLHTVTMDRNSPATVQSYNNNFTLVSASVRRLVFRLGGSTGDGNSRLLFDDLNTNASSYYGPATTCNSAPVAINDTINGLTGTQVSGNVMTNDNDPDGEFVRASIVATSGNGTVVLNPDGTFTFTPNPGFNDSSATFTYQLEDGGYHPMTSNTATVIIKYTVGIVLPVKLVSFQGSMYNDRVSLKWDVTENKNARRFEIERSINGRDFSAAGSVPSTGRSGRESYSFDNDINSNTKVMYRLKMIDNNNNADYSRVLIFQRENIDNIKVVNNPVNDKLTFSYISAYNQSVCVKVYDMTSRLHMNFKINVYPGLNVINFPLVPTIKNGIYLVDVNDGVQRHISKSAKFVKE
ncbi:MAG TPA: Ig-like domain-containing protein [Niastella sp.]